MLRLAAALVLLAVNSPAAEMSEPLPIGTIVQRLVEADNARLVKLDHYTAQRKYVLVNERFAKRAEMAASVSYKKSGEKSFDVLSENGSAFVRSRVLRRMLEAESDASQSANRAQTRFLPANYEFKLLGMDTTEGRPCYVLELIPRTENKYMLRGKVWIDAIEFAVVRVEGSPAKSPSFWIKDTKIIHQYAKVGSFWFPLWNKSTTEARVFGKTDVTIDYFDYLVNQPPTAQAVAPAR